MIRPLDLISPQYRDEQKKLHAHPRGFGGKGRKWTETVLWLVDYFGASSVLDYGCGQGSLATSLKAANRKGLRVEEYDPAIPGKDDSLTLLFADLVVCTDVLEHVEPDRLETVLAHLRLLARKAVFVVVNLHATDKTLSDGSNAHLLVKPMLWWQDRVQEAGFAFCDVPGMPMAQALTDRPEKQAKCWVAVLQP